MKETSKEGMSSKLYFIVLSWALTALLCQGCVQANATDTKEGLLGQEGSPPLQQPDVNYNQSVVYVAYNGVPGWSCGQNASVPCNSLQNALEIAQQGGTIVILNGTLKGVGNTQLNISKSITIV